jgi:fructose-bisphosphate aldolase class II/tagatose 1,6-diphosphate aldolase GatY/KbaY
VKETGIDWLAIAVGNAHGFYKGEPAIDLTRISEIAATTDAILVLHGSSGIPDAQLVAAVDSGITKINLATEIKHCFMQTLRNELEGHPGIDLREVFPVPTRAVASLIESKLQLFAKKDITTS